MVTDRVFELKEELLEQCKKAVNDRLELERLPEEDEEDLRQMITEEVRFWKGW